MLNLILCTLLVGPGSSKEALIDKLVRFEKRLNELDKEMQIIKKEIIDFANEYYDSYCHVCGVKVGQKHRGICSVGNGIYKGAS